MTDYTTNPVVLSGIRATGVLHLGNYMGALVNFARLDKDPDKDCFFFVATQHSLTTREDPDALDRDMREIVLTFLACGIDPEKSTIYVQSSVPETNQLAWLLACLAPVSELVTMPHFKDKADNLKGLGQEANGGLLTYPLLMAADILGPQANLVPVGDDQKPHVEFARRLARQFNKRYNTDLFPIPDLLEGDGKRVPGLQADGKMSKESGNQDGTIFLLDSAAEVERKVKRGVTDPQRVGRRDPGDPNVCNIFTMHHMFSTPEEIAWAQTGCQTAGIGCVECKRVIWEHINARLAPIQERRRELEAEGVDVEEILHEGGKRARARIKPVVEEALELAGVRVY